MIEARNFMPCEVNSLHVEVRLVRAFAIIAWIEMSEIMSISEKDGDKSTCEGL